jgi:hypothetical protein
MSTRGCPPLGALVKPNGINHAKMSIVIRKLVIGTGIVAILIGIGIGLTARSMVGDNPAPNDPVSELSTPALTSVPTLTPPRVASAVTPSVARPAPTLAVPTVVIPLPTPVSRDVVMELSEADLDQQFTSMLVGQSLGKTPLGDARVQSVAVQLRDRQVKLDGNAQVGFMRAPFTVTGTVTPTVSGRPLVSVSEASVGGVLLPESARSALAESVQTQVDNMFVSQGDVKVRTIDIADGKMRVVGYR